MTWMWDFSVAVASNLATAAILGIFAAWLWPSRMQALAVLRLWVRVKDVNLYLSADEGYWCIEVPFRYVNDVKWRLRAFDIRSIRFYSSSTSDDHSQAFQFRIAGYDQAYSDDLPDIREVFDQARIQLALWCEWRDQMMSPSPTS